VVGARPFLSPSFSSLLTCLGVPVCASIYGQGVRRRGKHTQQACPRQPLTPPTYKQSSRILQPVQAHCLHVQRHNPYRVSLVTSIGSSRTCDCCCAGRGHFCLDSRDQRLDTPAFNRSPLPLPKRHPRRLPRTKHSSSTTPSPSFTTTQRQDGPTTGGAGPGGRGMCLGLCAHAPPFHRRATSAR